MYVAAMFWMFLMIFFLFMETNTVALVSIWFAVGSLAAAVAALLGANLTVQILIGLGVSAVLLACLRPLVRKYLKPKIVPTNIDAIIGTTGYVTATIDNLAPTGQVKLGAMEWTARSSSGDAIPEKTLVKVDRIEGVKVFVSVVE